MRNQTLSDKLEASRLLICNSQEADVAPLLANVGVNTDYITDGQNLYQETIQLFEAQQKEYQEQHLAFDEFHLAKDELQEKRRKTLKLVNILARNDRDLQQRLKIPFSQIGTLDKWIDESIAFYNRLLNEPEFVGKLERFKYDTVAIQADIASFEELKELRNKAVAEKGQAQEATRLRNTKLDELDDYTRELKGIASLALETKPQLLEKLGIVVRS
ncbi:MAG: hypothetical protein NXI20_03130 [bacterium]|nr:hypothetical protein [bacterium]